MFQDLATSNSLEILNQLSALYPINFYPKFIPKKFLNYFQKTKLCKLIVHPHYYQKNFLQKLIKYKYIKM